MEDWKEMKDDVKAIRELLQSENGLCVRLSVVETKQDSLQTELTEHKNNHWTMYGILLAVASLVVGIFEFRK